MESLLLIAILIFAGGVLTVSADWRLRTIAAFCGVIAVGGWFLFRPNFDEHLDAALPAKVTEGRFMTSDTCQSCHPGPYDGWRRSYHSSMTQRATPSAVLGFFDGIVLEDRGFTYRLERHGDQFWVEMPDPLWFREPKVGMPPSPPRIKTRVVMTTGSHHMQNYWVRRPDAGEFYLRPDDGALLQLPWTWLIEDKRWVPTQSSFLTPPTSHSGMPQVWNGNCSQCHSVATQPGSPSFDSYDTRSVELGIACEACHGPAAEHVRANRSPLRRYRRYLNQLIGGEDKGDPTIVNPARLEPRRSVETCGQCHSFSTELDLERYWQLGVAFRPGGELDSARAVFRYTQNPTHPLLLEELKADPLAMDGRFWPDGTIRVAGREYNGLLESACFQAGPMTCLSCHSMHGYEKPADQLDPKFTGDRSCLSCHTNFQDRVTQHTRHAPESSGSACANCHMPHTTYGLFSAIRSHRIDSPSAKVSAETGRPNACNLCHLDQPLEWTSRYLSDWYGQPTVELSGQQRSVAASILWALKGDAVQRTIIGWHMGWRPAQEASSMSWLAPYLAQLLADPYAVTRQVAHRSILTLPGFHDFAFNYVASASELAEKANEAMTRWMRTGGASQAGPHLLVDEYGNIDFQKWLPIIAERDNRPLTIIE